MKNTYEGPQFLIKLQALGLLELNSFTGFLYRFSPLDTLQNTYFCRTPYNTRYFYIFQILVWKMSSRKRKRSEDEEWPKRKQKREANPKISFALFIHKNCHSIIISPVLTMEKILPGPNWKYCIKLEVDGFKKMLVCRIECKMCVI